MGSESPFYLFVIKQLMLDSLYVSADLTVWGVGKPKPNRISVE